MNPKATCPDNEQNLGTGAQLRPRMKRDGVLKLKERAVPSITVRLQTRSAIARFKRYWWPAA